MAVGRISYQTAFAFNQEWITVEFGLRYESERFQDLIRDVNTPIASVSAVQRHVRSSG